MLKIVFRDHACDLVDGIPAVFLDVKVEMGEKTQKGRAIICPDGAGVIGYTASIYKIKNESEVQAALEKYRRGLRRAEELEKFNSNLFCDFVEKCRELKNKKFELVDTGSKKVRNYKSDEFLDHNNAWCTRYTQEMAGNIIKTLREAGFNLDELTIKFIETWEPRVKYSPAWCNFLGEAGESR